MEPLLQAEHLSISFTQYDRGTRRLSLPVIRDLTFAIRPGQVTAVVGSSGSGKSLLAHGILGILPYNASLEGTIAYGGEPLTRRRVEAFRGREIRLRVWQKSMAGCSTPWDCRIRELICSVREIFHS